VYKIDYFQKNIKSHQNSNVIPKGWYVLSIHVRILRINVRILYAIYVFSKGCMYFTKWCCWRVCKRWRRDEEVHSSVVSSALVFLVLRKSKPHNRRLRLLVHNRVTHHGFKCSLVRFESSFYLRSSRKQRRKAPGTVLFLSQNMILASNQEA
jgi:hypothetical protein